MTRRGLLPGLILVAILPLTLLLIVFAIGATTLHQNEMRDMIAHAQRADRARSRAESGRTRAHHLTKLRALAEPPPCLATRSGPPPRSGPSILRTAWQSMMHDINVNAQPDHAARRRVLAQARSTDGAMAAYNILSTRELELPVFGDTMPARRLHVCCRRASAAALSCRSYARALRFAAHFRARCQRRIAR